MLVRDKEFFTKLGCSNNTENKGKYIDSELNAIIKYLQKILISKLKKIDNKEILTKGLKDQLLAIKNKKMQWTNVDSFTDQSVSYGQIKSNEKDGIIVYSNKWESKQPSKEGDYYVKISNNILNFTEDLNLSVKRKAFFKDNVITNIRQFFENSAYDFLYGVKIEEQPAKNIKRITKKSILDYLRNNPTKKLFTLKKLKNNEYRDLKKINFLPYQILPFCYNMIRVRNKFIACLDNDNDNDNFKTDKGFIKLNSPLQRDSESNFNPKDLNKTNFKYTTSNLMKDFIFVKSGDGTTIHNNKILEISKILPMQWYKAGYRGEPRKLDLTWEGLPQCKLTENCLELEDIKSNYTEEVYNAFKKYIDNKGK